MRSKTELPEPAEPASALPGHVPSWTLRSYPIPEWATAESNKAASVLVSTQDHHSRWRQGNRFHDLFDRQCFHLDSQAQAQIALDYGSVTFSYADLAGFSNQIARFLHAEEVEGGDHMAILLDRSVLAPATVLAVSRLGVSYVPLDAGFPTDRINHIITDSGVTGVLTQRCYLPLFREVDVPVVAIDDHMEEIHSYDSGIFEPDDLRDVLDPTAYVIYTSGSTGLPKGVPIRHSSICNFLDVASSLYGYTSDDRVYQGMTIAFDFSVEELWVPLCCGATVVPASSDIQLLGSDLQQFLHDRQISALCCVPTLLSTLQPNLTNLRFLLVSGEACPRDLIDPWLSPGRRVLNAYGPTEATVTATWSVLEPGNPITIGGPLPTYSVVVLDPDERLVVEPGQEGEICLAGIALSDGYLNRPSKTEEAFIEDFIGIADNPSGLIYRTGDLGRINQKNEIEYLGRIDTQVKIRGYRIELEEIESVAGSLPGIGSCVVQPFSPGGSGTALVAYLTPGSDGALVNLGDLDRRLRDRLPTYMVPTFYEHIDLLPLLPSSKVDRKALPAPSGIRFVNDDQPIIGPSNEIEFQLERALAEVLGLERVSITANFFADLGADSLTLAGFANAIRQDLTARPVSMKLLYQNPTIAELALAMEQAKETRGASTTTGTQTGTDTDSPGSVVLDSTPSRTAMPVHRASRRSHLLTGAGQLLLFLVSTLILIMGITQVLSFIDQAEGPTQVYLYSVLAGVAGLSTLSVCLIAIKWLAVGRFTIEPIPVWSMRYFRFWVAKQAISLNPLNLFVGTPAYNSYLRALGTKVGPGTVILARPPVCTDLIEIGANTIIRQNCSFQGYKAERGYLLPGPVRVGSDSLICDATVLDIDTVVGNSSELGTSSALLEGQGVPDHQTFHGSPAEPTSQTYNRVAPRDLPAWLRSTSVVLRFLSISLLGTPIALLLAGAVLKLIDDADTFSFVPSALSNHDFLRLMTRTAALTTVLFVAVLVIGLVTVGVVPRILNLFVRPQQAHRLFGLQYMLARSIARFSNSNAHHILFGDSSLILHYLRFLGFGTSEAVQTGSNFGSDQRHHSPFLCEVRGETIASDGLVFLNNEYSSTSFISQPIALPPDTYLGNFVQVPSGAAIGPNCLIGTKAAVPTDGPCRSGVGLLGSPAFEIPRSVSRDHTLDRFDDPGIRADRLRRKLRSNLASLALYLGRSWLVGFGSLLLTLVVLSSVTFQTGLTSLDKALPFLLSVAVLVPGAAAFFVFSERLTLRFRRLEPLYCSLYDERFWAHERFWKSNYNGFVRLFNGTPFKPLILRAQGMRIGSMLFDDGASTSEPTLIQIGDDCMLNNRSWIMCHSLEDGTFKSDRVKVGHDCTIGVGAFVHYGTVMGTGSSLEADTFFMKGTVAQRSTRWQGNPATEIHRTAS